jgi:SAM-dependent methyltransferase
MTDLKTLVKDHWERETCGTRYGDETLADRRAYFDEIERTRYEQDDMLKAFARFEESRGLRVLEVGLGTGTDFVQWLRNGAIATGRDLTDASVALVRERVELEGFEADVRRGDAEALDLPSDTFDIYYSWGVLHHTPNPQRAFAEAHRVLKPGGTLRIMLYNYPSVGAILVWLLRGPLRLKFIGPRRTYAEYVESPGTLMFSEREAREALGTLFDPSSISCATYLGAGDLLTQKLSSRYRGAIWRIVQRLYPRWFIRHVIGNKFGTVLTVEARKQASTTSARD